MKKLIFALLTIAVSAGFSFGQSKDEQEIRSIHTGLEQAYVNGEIAPFEAVLADNYVVHGPDGKVQNRAQLLADMRKEIASPTFKTVSETSDDIKINVIGSAAYVTSGWTTVSKMLNPETEPHTDKGRYVGVYEKRNGKWMLVAETFTEQQHDRKLMEEQVLAASNAFDSVMKSRDLAAYEKLLHPDFIYTSQEGEVVTRTEEIAHFSSPDTVIKTVEASDKKVRIVGNSAAVETGIYRVTGTYKGKPFEEKGRYTTTWIWREQRWQMIADHNSLIKK